MQVVLIFIMLQREIRSFNSLVHAAVLCIQQLEGIMQTGKALLQVEVDMETYQSVDGFGRQERIMCFKAHIDKVAVRIRPDRQTAEKRVDQCNIGSRSCCSLRLSCRCERSREISGPLGCSRSRVGSPSLDL